MMQNESRATDNSSQPRAVIVGATRAQLRTFAQAIERAGYRVTITATVDGITATIAQPVALLVYSQSVDDTAILAGYRALPQRPDLIRLDGELALPGAGFAALEQIPFDANELEALLRRHLASPDTAETTDHRPPTTDRSTVLLPSIEPAPTTDHRPPTTDNTPLDGEPAVAARDDEPPAPPAPSDRSTVLLPSIEPAPTEPTADHRPPTTDNTPLDGEPAVAALDDEPTTPPATTDRSTVLLPSIEPPAPTAPPASSDRSTALNQRGAASLSPHRPATPARPEATPQDRGRRWRASVLWIGVLLGVVLIVGVAWRLSSTAVVSTFPESPSAAIPTAPPTSAQPAGNSATAPAPTASTAPPATSPSPIAPTAPNPGVGATAVQTPNGTDLRVEIAGITPQQPQAGQVVNIRVLIRNVGTQDATAPFWVDLYVAPQSLPAVNRAWPDISVYGATWLIDGLAAGESRLVETLSADPARSNLLRAPSADQQQIYILVDSYGDTSNGTVMEQDEANNLTGPFSLGIAQE